ncbi:Ig-like domain repeat protein, partial [Streptomyces sp. TRM76130]|nr:Ig-like domain repeat protein [Streptomyces sp. TRM76130]
MASIGKATTPVPTGTDPFTVDLGPHASGLTLQTALRSWVPTGSLDGTYTLTLTCQSGYGVAPRFLAKITVVGETWTMVQQQVTAVSLTAPAQTVPVNGDLALTAQVSPAEATGSVEFRKGDESLGTATVTDGVATKTVKAPAIGGPHTYTAVFTSADQDAYGNSEGSLLVSIDYIVTARAADGTLLGDVPTLAIGESAKITVQGFTPGATVKVTQENATGATFPDATADAQGTVADYAFTVPDRTISGETDLYFAEGGSASSRALFTFNAVDEPTDDPTDPADLE